MSKEEDLIAAAAKAKVDISSEIDAFIAKIDASTNDPQSFLSMSQLEDEWTLLEHLTHKSYSSLVSEAVSAIETPEVIESKKDNSAPMESS